MKNLIITILFTTAVYSADAQYFNGKDYKLFGRMTNYASQLRINENGFDITHTGVKNTIVVNGKEMWLEPLENSNHIQKAMVDGNTYLVWIGDSSGGYVSFGYIAICYFKETKLIEDFATWVDWMEAAKGIYQCERR